MMDRKTWYNLIAKFQGREAKESMYYAINEAEDSTNYTLELGGGRYVEFNKQRNLVQFFDGNVSPKLGLTLGDLRVIFNFAKKNGVI